MPAVAIILTHYDTAQYLKQSVASLLNQSFKDFDLHVVDDHTNGGDWVESLREFAGDPRLRVHRSSKNVGTYQLKNAIISRQLDCRYIAFQDADDFSLPTRLERQLECLREGGFGIVGANYYELIGGSRLSAVRMPEKPTRRHLRRGRAYLSLHPTWVVDWSVFEALVRFDGTTRIAGDDEFLYRALFATSVCNAQGFLYVKRMHPESLVHAPATGMSSVLRHDYVSGMKEKLVRLRRANALQLEAELIGTPGVDEFELTDIDLAG